MTEASSPVTAFAFSGSSQRSGRLASVSNCGLLPRSSPIFKYPRAFSNRSRRTVSSSEKSFTPKHPVWGVGFER